MSDEHPEISEEKGQSDSEMPDENEQIESESIEEEDQSGSEPLDEKEVEGIWRAMIDYIIKEQMRKYPY